MRSLWSANCVVKYQVQFETLDASIKAYSLRLFNMWFFTPLYMYFLAYIVQLLVIDYDFITGMVGGKCENVIMNDEYLF